MIQPRVWVAVAAVSVLALVLASCVTGKERSAAQTLVERWAAALESRDVQAAAELTSYPGAAGPMIEQLFDGLSPQEVHVTPTQFVDLTGASGIFTTDVRWAFGDGKEWRYSVGGQVRELSIGWRISWDPSLLVPDLGGGDTVRYDRTDATPAPSVLDAAGRPLMTEQIINSVMLDPASMPDPVATTGALADAIAPVAPLITGASMLRELAAAPGDRITAVTLRNDDYAVLAKAITGIPGVVVTQRPLPITSDRRITSPLLDGLRNVWQSNRDASAGWAVHVVKPDGSATRQTGFQGPPGPDIRATLDPRIQLAATDAVVSVGTPAAIVAIQPSSGAVLAAAQNNQATELGPIAFTGLYPAGSTLDLVRSAAAMEHGGDPADVSAETLRTTAAQFGLGVEYEIPGLEVKTARFTRGLTAVAELAGPEPDHATVTPFGMALAAASVAHGGPPTPRIVQDQEASTRKPVTALDRTVTDRLRDAMREHVQTGPASSLKGYSGLVGMTGAADDDRWFFGARDDLAFAVFVAAADGSDQALKVTGRLLRALG